MRLELYRLGKDRNWLCRGRGAARLELCRWGVTQALGAHADGAVLIHLSATVRYQAGYSLYLVEDGFFVRQHRADAWTKVNHYELARWAAARGWRYGQHRSLEVRILK